MRAYKLTEDMWVLKLIPFTVNWEGYESLCKYGLGDGKRLQGS